MLDNDVSRSQLPLSMCIVTFLLVAGCAGNSGQEAAGKTYFSSRVDMPEARVAPIPLDLMNKQQLELLGVVDGSPPPKRALSSLHPTLMHNPGLMEVYYPLGDKVFRAPEFPAKQRELIILRVAWLYQDKYEWANHQINALEAGWTSTDLERIKVAADENGWERRDRALLMATDQIVTNAYLNDETWADLREFYSVSDIMILITMVTHFHWVATITRSFGVQPDAPLRYFE